MKISFFRPAVAALVLVLRHGEEAVEVELSRERYVNEPVETGETVFFRPARPGSFCLKPKRRRPTTSSRIFPPV